MQRRSAPIVARFCFFWEAMCGGCCVRWWRWAMTVGFVVMWMAGGASVRALTPTPTPGPVAITAPKPHQALQGQVRVLGVTDVAGFKTATLYFGYAGDPTHTWFWVATRHIPTHEGLIARWDTTTITDGDYVLRLVVQAADGRQWEATVPVRVRNYTPVETPTPAPAMGGTPPPTPSATPVPTATPRWPTPTPLPPNPARLPADTLSRAGLYGAGALLGLLLAFGALRRWR